MTKDMEFKAAILFLAVEYMRECVNNGSTEDQAVIEAQSEYGQQEIAKRYKLLNA